MKLRYVVVVIALGILGLAAFSGLGWELYRISKESSATPDYAEAKTQWLNSYTEEVNRSTSAGYACISEIWSLTFHPVNSGPVCRDYCKQLREIDKVVSEAPAYIDNPKQYLLEESGGACAVEASER